MLRAVRAVPVFLVALALCLKADALTDIVAFGDSLTDDCTHGASALVDSVLDTNQVYAHQLHAVSISLLQLRQSAL